MKPKPRSAMTFLTVPVAKVTSNIFSNEKLTDARSVREGVDHTAHATQRGERPLYHPYCEQTFAESVRLPNERTALRAPIRSAPWVTPTPHLKTVSPDRAPQEAGGPEHQ